jgi:hypothetical protein
MRDKYTIQCHVHNIPPNLMNHTYTPSFSSLTFMYLHRVSQEHVRWLFTGSSKVKYFAPTLIANSTARFTEIPPVSAQHPNQCWDTGFTNAMNTHLQFGSQFAISRPGKTCLVRLVFHEKSQYHERLATFSWQKNGQYVDIHWVWGICDGMHGQQNTGVCSNRRHPTKAAIRNDTSAVARPRIFHHQVARNTTAYCKEFKIKKR